MSYPRVVPRDFFNEAKLLKCLGMIALAVVDDKFYAYDLEVEHELEESESGFIIDFSHVQDGLFCSNYWFKVNGYLVDFFSRYNSHENYPLQFLDSGGNVYSVMDEKGGFTQEFVEHLKHLATLPPGDD